MANGKTHAAVGIASGGVYLALSDRSGEDQDWLLHVLAGMAGGYVGAKLPDLLEPPISSWHRDFVHSLTAGVGTVALAPDWFRQLEDYSRRQIGQHQFIVLRTVDPQERSKAELAILFWRLLIPFLRGVRAGYVSHLVLDATTPRGLPWLVSGDVLQPFGR